MLQKWLEKNWQSSSLIINNIIQNVINEYKTQEQEFYELQKI